MVSKFFFSRYSAIGGMVLVVFGFILMPFIIGIPLLMLGGLLMITAALNKYYGFLPSAWRQKTEVAVKKSFEPHQNTLSSFKAIIKSMLKAAGIFLLVALVIGIIYFLIVYM